MDANEVARKIKGENFLRVKMIIELAGFPKEHLVKTMDGLMDELKKQEYLEVLKTDISDPKEVGEKMISLFSEIEFIAENASCVMAAIFDFMPSSVEIIEPEQITEQTQDITEMLNDLAAKLHTYDMTVKKLRAENMVLARELHKRAPELFKTQESGAEQPGKPQKNGEK